MERSSINDINRSDLEQRIEWADIYKAIAIILVVIGHATGKFNPYIYQFHMAAFFFISGYLTNIEKRNLVHTIMHKCRSLLLPFVTIFFLMLILTKILVLSDLYEYLLPDEMVYSGIRTILVEFFLYGNNYLWWMGATWFILVLFEVSILQKLIQILFKKPLPCLLASVACFMIAYILNAKEVHLSFLMFGINLCLIGQMYFAIGLFLRRMKRLDSLKNRWYFHVAGLTLTLSIMIFIRAVLGTVVDYPSLSFGFIISDFIAAFNGILFLLFLSKLLSIALPTWCNAVMQFIGKNSIAVLYFHFAAFKVAFVLIALAGFIPNNSIDDFIPATSGIGDVWWPVFVVIGISVSICVWKGLSIIKPISMLLYENRNAFFSVHGKENLL